MGKQCQYSCCHDKHFYTLYYSMPLAYSLTSCTSIALLIVIIVKQSVSVGTICLYIYIYIYI